MNVLQRFFNRRGPPLETRVMLPRWRLMRWLAGCQRDLPDDVIRRLNGGAIMKLPLILGGMFCALSIGLVALLEAYSPFLAGWLVVQLGLAGWRVGLEYRAHRRRLAGRAVPVDGTMLFLVLWMLSLGVLCAFAIIYASSVVALMAISTTLVVASLCPALCIGRPIFSTLLVLLCDLPIKLAVPFQSEPLFWLFIPQAPVYWWITHWFACQLNGWAERALINENRSRLEADYDQLTGLHSRYGFYRVVETLRLKTVEQLPAALLYLDLDGFKQINDRMGHEAGDALLSRIARHCSHTLRREDAMVRWGGDEFLVLLPGASGPLPALVAERLLAEVRALGSDYPGIGISIGISSHDDCRTLDRDTLERLVNRADASLYEAKRAGKGCYRVAS